MGNMQKKTMRILLVDNQNDGLKKMASMLRRRYTEIDLCEDMKDVKASFFPDRYDIVIIALEMDKNEGYHCVDYIYSISPRQRIVTYSSEPDHPSHGAGCPVCMKENRRHRIKKPVMLPELFDEIENFDEKICSFAETAMKMYEGYVSEE